MNVMGVLVILLLVSVNDTGAATRYVRANNSTPASPYTTWSTAAREIQAAINIAADGDVIMVTNGVYSSGGRPVNGNLTNRVAVTKSVMVQSVNGPAVTTIRGQGLAGDSAVRCAYLTNGAVLAGFTLTNGATRTSMDGGIDLTGGGVWLDHGGVVSNCVIIGNVSEYEGGGAYCNYGGILQHCTIISNRTGSSTSACSGGGVHCENGGVVQNCVVASNWAFVRGGGVYCVNGGTVKQSTLVNNTTPGDGGGGYIYNSGLVQNCVVAGNSAHRGGGFYGASGGSIQNTTITGNQADWGGGIYSEIKVSVLNTIVYFNAAAESSNCFSYSTYYTNCCIFPAVGVNCVTNEPGFVDVAAGDYHLVLGSPCVDAGVNLEPLGLTNDFSGRSRPIDGDGDGFPEFDIGTYENSFAPDLSPWRYRMKLTFRGYTRAEVLTDFPALVRLNENTSAFRYTNCASSNGGDLRFSDAAGTTLLAHEIENWNVNGEAIVWVRVPVLAGTNTSIWACWGNPYATNPPAYTTNGATWSEGYRGVWHMNTTNLVDSSSNKLSAIASGLATATALAGRGQWFQGSSSYAQVMDTVDPTAYTLMALVQPAVASNQSILVRTSASGPTSDWSHQLRINSSNRFEQYTLATPFFCYATGTRAVNLGIVQQVAGVAINGTSNSVRLYVNGIQDGTIANAGTLWTNGDRWRFGSNSGHGMGYFNGVIDEIRISSVSRSSNWIWAVWANIVSNAAFNPYSNYEEHLVAYVSTNGADIYPYTNWATAARTIQAGVDAVGVGGTVWVNDGVYAGGGRVLHGLSNRVAITRAMTIQSVNGPSNTWIVGAADPVTTNGPAATRCAYITNGVVLSGFTLAGGHTLDTGDADLAQSGGGVFSDWDGGMVSNCVITGNSAASSGGGAYFWYCGDLVDCTLVSNSAAFSGGGVVLDSGNVERCVFMGNKAKNGGGISAGWSGPLRNCVLAGNVALDSGGGASLFMSTLENCTVIDNSAVNEGGGVYCFKSTTENCIIYFNHSSLNENWCGSGPDEEYYFCCTIPAIGQACVTGDPRFVNRPIGDLRLQFGSPCVDAGITQAWMSAATDVQGSPRILGSRVDIGAFEAGSPVAVTIDGNGSVVPSGEIWVPMGNNITFAITPDAAHHVETILLDGVPVGASTSYTLFTVTNAHTLKVVFAVDYFSQVFVATNGGNVFPYTNWTTAARVIQDAVDAASDGTKIWVSNGVYAAGGSVVHGDLTNRVTLTRAISMQSVNGPVVTSILGIGSYGLDAVRCAYVTNGALLAGFTLVGGSTRVEGAVEATRGGGVWVESGGTVSNCVMSNNSAYNGGGGVACNFGGLVLSCVINGNGVYEDGGGIYCHFGGVISNCTVINNNAFNGGGVACHSGGTIKACLIAGNSAMLYGGGIYNFTGGMEENCLILSNRCLTSGAGIALNAGGAVHNCTVCENVSDYLGGGVWRGEGGTVDNSIIYFNSAADNGDNYFTDVQSVFTNCCTTPAVGSLSVTNDPLFVNRASSDYRLAPGSPCINTGSNQPWMAGAFDLDGRPRLIAGTVDMGAYEMGYCVTAVKQSHGSLVPSGTLWVTPGTNLAFTITPASSFALQSLMVDGVSIALTNQYTFFNVSSNHTIYATFIVTNFFPRVYVATDQGNVLPYTNWATAARVIQDAVDAAREGSIVLISNGIYSAGGMVVGGLTNRVAITRATAVYGVNRFTTVILGRSDPNSINGPAAIRCAYLTNGATLAGVTLFDGHTRETSYSGVLGRDGGGALLDGGGVISNCAIGNCSASWDGGGVYCSLTGLIFGCTVYDNRAGGTGGGVAGQWGGTIKYSYLVGNAAGTGGGIYVPPAFNVVGCSIDRNVASYNGGGAYCEGVVQESWLTRNSSSYGGGIFLVSAAIARNCMIYSNTAIWGGGADLRQSAILDNCTVADNLATNYGGGVRCYQGGTLRNTIIYFNEGTYGDNYWNEGAGMSYRNCCTLPVYGYSCVTNDPLFISRFTGNFRIGFGSRCVDAGTNLSASGVIGDIYGHSRPQDGNFDGTNTFDIGATEYSPTTDDTDGDGLNDAAEFLTHHTSPTNVNTDGDAANDGEEVVADTDPLDPVSYFHIVAVSNLQPAKAVCFPSSSNRIYTLLWTTNLISGSWTNLPGATPATGNGHFFWLSDTNATSPRFYRVRVCVP